MATQSVKLNDVGCWAPLLKGLPQYIDDDGPVKCSLTADELKRVQSSADEVIRVVIDGFSAIGELQWRAAAYDSGSIDADVFGLLAPLQTQLAELVATLRVTEANAGYHLHELEAARAKHAAQPAAGA